MFAVLTRSLLTAAIHGAGLSSAASTVGTERHASSDGRRDVVGTQTA